MHRAWKTLLATSAGLVVAAAGLTVSGTASASVNASAAAAAEPDPVLGAPVFNNPTGDEAAQYAVFQQLARVIDRVPAGADLELSWFEFKTPDHADTATRPDIIDRLLQAHQRGVNVRIILDNSDKDGGLSNEKEAPFKRLSPVLGQNDAAASFIVLCPKRKGCVAKRPLTYSNGTKVYAYNHNKFLLASQIVLNDGSVRQGVVVQTSSNLGTWDATTAFNNAMTWSDTSSYAMYRSYFNDLRTMRTGTGNDDYNRVGDAADEFRPHFFPRRETNGDYNQASTDTIINVLDTLKCWYKGVHDNADHQTDVRLVMWSFSRIAVAKKLAALVKAGCWVDVVYSTTNDATLAALKNVGGKPIGITACQVPHQGRNIRAHSKYMLIDGQIGADQVPRVFTGSPNLSMASLRNADEAMVEIRSNAVHHSYQWKNFYTVRDTCKKTAPAAAAATVMQDVAGAEKASAAR